MRIYKRPIWKTRIPTKTLAIGIKNKGNAISYAKKMEKKGWRGVTVIPLRSYGKSRPFGWDILAKKFRRKR